MSLLRKSPQMLMAAVLLAALALASLWPAPAQAQRPMSPASKEAGRPNQVYVPGHWAWNPRRRQYVWVPSRWERAQRGEAYVGARWTFRNGRWQFGPAH